MSELKLERARVVSQEELYDDTHLIVDRVIKNREQRRWTPAKKLLLRNLKAACEHAFLAWDTNKTANPNQAALRQPLSPEAIGRLVDELEAELNELNVIPDREKADAREPRYWRAQLHGLSTVARSLARAVDRAQIVLSEEPDLVIAINELEWWYGSMPGLDAFLDGLEAQMINSRTQQLADKWTEQANLAPVLVVKVLNSFLDLWRKLDRVPGLVE